MKSLSRLHYALTRELKSRAFRWRGRFTSQGTSGAKFHCPCCNCAFSEWLDFDPTYTQRLCPNCLSHPRHRALIAFLRQQGPISLQSQARLLHVAPEPFLRKSLLRLAQLHVISLSRFSPRTDVRGDLMALPFADQKFDHILCSHVLEHVKDDQRAMAELYRVLKPGGWAMVNVPLRTSLARTLEADPSWTRRQRAQQLGGEDHLRLYGTDYFTRLQNQGFKVHRYSPESQFGLEGCEQMNLDPYEELIFACKPSAESGAFPWQERADSSL